MSQEKEIKIEDGNAKEQVENEQVSNQQAENPDAQQGDVQKETDTVADKTADSNDSADKRQKRQS